jgi:hypothetical protein
MRVGASTLPAEARARESGVVRIGLLGGFSVSVGTARSLKARGDSGKQPAS